MQQVGISLCTYIPEVVSRAVKPDTEAVAHPLPADNTSLSQEPWDRLWGTQIMAQSVNTSSALRRARLPAVTPRCPGDPPGLCVPPSQGAQRGSLLPEPRRSHHAFGRTSRHMSARPCLPAAPSEDTIPAPPLAPFPSAVTFSRARGKPHRPSVPPIA